MNAVIELPLPVQRIVDELRNCQRAVRYAGLVARASYKHADFFNWSRAKTRLELRYERECGRAS